MSGHVGPIGFDFVVAEVDDLDEALVEFLGRAVELTGDNSELAALTASLPKDRVEAVFGHSQPVESLISANLRPLLERAHSGARPPVEPPHGPDIGAAPDIGCRDSRRRNAPARASRPGRDQSGSRVAQ